MSEELYRQKARPFIPFPVDDSTEGWIQVARDVETMINYLIEEKCENVAVAYIDRRDPDGSVCDPRDYGLAVDAFRERIPGEEATALLEQLKKDLNIDRDGE